MWWILQHPSELHSLHVDTLVRGFNQRYLIDEYNIIVFSSLSKKEGAAHCSLLQYEYIRAGMLETNHKKTCYIVKSYAEAGTTTNAMVKVLSSMSTLKVAEKLMAIFTLYTYNFPIILTLLIQLANSCKKQ